MRIRQNECVEGIGVRLDSCLKTIMICQLADDTTIFVKNIQSAKEASKVVENFGKVSGTKLNKSKTEVLWQGDHPPPQNFLGDTPWTHGPFKSLVSTLVKFQLKQINSTGMTILKN